MAGKAYLMITEKLEFGAGLPAEILGVTFASSGNQKTPQPHFRVWLADVERLVPIEPTTHYLFLSESDVKMGKIPEIFD